MNISQIMRFGGVDLYKQKRAKLEGTTINNVRIDGLYVLSQYYIVDDFYRLPPEKKAPILIQLVDVDGYKVFLVGFFQYQFLQAITYAEENLNL